MVHEERRIRNALQTQHKLNAVSFETEEYRYAAARTTHAARLRIPLSCLKLIRAQLTENPIEGNHQKALEA